MTKTKTVTIYGIRNCDTMKRARAWLDAHGVDYTFHDYKTAGIEQGVLEGWVRKVVGRGCSTGPARRIESCRRRTRRV